MRERDGDSEIDRKRVNKTEMKEKYEKEATRALAEREGKNRARTLSKRRGRRETQKEKKVQIFLHEDDGGGVRKREMTRISWK